MQQNQCHIIPMLHIFSPETEVRFWSKVSILGPADCWPWVAGRDGNPRRGYGRFHANGAGWDAHRFCYALHHASLLANHVIAHSCGNVLCMNPAHLVQVPRTDSVAHKRRRETNQYVLSDEKIMAIRQAYDAGGVTMKAVGDRYGLPHSAVYAIITGAWAKHLPVLYRVFPQGSMYSRWPTPTE